MFSPAINEPLWSRTTTANPTALMTATDEREQSTVSDEATPLGRSIAPDQLITVEKQR